MLGVGGLVDANRIAPLCRPSDPEQAWPERRRRNDQLGGIEAEAPLQREGVDCDPCKQQPYVDMFNEMGLYADVSVLGRWVLGGM